MARGHGKPPHHPGEPGDSGEESSRTGGFVGVTVATAATVAGVTPPFLIGGLSVFMGPDLGFDEAGLGLAVSFFFTLAAILSVPAGWLGDRLGARRALRISMTVSMFGLVGIGAVAQSLPVLMAFMAFGALGNAMAQTAGNALILATTPYRRQAISFAVKQSAAPFANLAGGAAVPLVGLTIGWRWAFFATAVLCLLMFVRMPAGTIVAAAGTGAIRKMPLVVLAAAAACATAAANASGAFLVPALVAEGSEPGPAGVVLAVGGVVGIAVRMISGWSADRFKMDSLLVATLLVASGVVGMIIMALGPDGPGLLLAVVLIFGGGWGFNGLLVFAVTRSYPLAPARATGMTQTGVFAGGVFGPSLFALAATTSGYPVAWLTAAALAFAATVFFAVGRLMLRRHQGRGA